MPDRPFSPRLQMVLVGSMPHTDPDEACRLIFEHCPDMPCWPQLPRRTFRENMYAQYSERFPGVVLESDRMWVDRTRDLDPELETLYLADLEQDLSYGETTPDFALGLHTFLDKLADLEHAPALVKGQVTGPVSWGLTVLDQDRRPTLYDDVLADAIARHLALKARWQEDVLGQAGNGTATSVRTIMSVDEPYMSAFGSAYVAVSREQVIELLEHVFAAIHGIKMVHCCGNTDWSILMDTSVDILNFDAYEYAVNLALYPDEVKAFLARGGILAWGITPKSDEAYRETVDSLVAKLLAGMDLLVQKGIHLDDLLQASLISPSCGLGPASEALAGRILELTSGVSKAMQERYG
ncbi:MAG: methionine synthase [Anaerolineae bacterium]|nr:methionine synthase [Anaerolineae bacterium]